jgi:hypothetical protein
MAALPLCPTPGRVSSVCGGMHFSSAILFTCLFLFLAIRPNCTAQPSLNSDTSTETSTKWLLTYKRGGDGLVFLRKNARLRALLEAGLPHYGVPWWRKYHTDLPLPDGAFHAISLSPSSVTVDANRFVTITGTSPGTANFRGLLWSDTAAEQPTLIFVFMMMHQGSAEGSASLDIYTNRDDADSPMPPQLINSILEWLKESRIKIVKQATVHDVNDRTASLSTSDLSPQ